MRISIQIGFGFCPFFKRLCLVVFPTPPLLKTKKSTFLFSTMARTRLQPQMGTTPSTMSTRQMDDEDRRRRDEDGRNCYNDGQTVYWKGRHNQICIGTVLCKPRYKTLYKYTVLPHQDYYGVGREVAELIYYTKLYKRARYVPERELNKESD